MNKLICVGLVSMFLLICLNAFSAIGTNVKTNSDSWVSIIKPTDGSTIYFPLIIESDASEDVDQIVYRMIYQDTNNYHTWYRDLGSSREQSLNFRISISMEDLRGMWGWQLFDELFAEYARVQIYACAYDISNGGGLLVAESSKITVKLMKDSPPHSPPETPCQPFGTQYGKIGEPYFYKVVTTDVDEDQIYYLFDWGDGTDSGWVGPYDSYCPDGNDDDVCEMSHIWSAKGNYNIKVKAKDVYDMESDWSKSLPITMPNSRISNNILLMRFFERFPNAFPLIRQIF